MSSTLLYVFSERCARTGTLVNAAPNDVIKGTEICSRSVTSAQFPLHQRSTATPLVSFQTRGAIHQFQQKAGRGEGIIRRVTSRGSKMKNNNQEVETVWDL